MKIVLLTNILSPYRKVFYDKLYQSFQEKGVEFTVLVMAETEPNREWHYNEYKGEYCELLDSRTVTAGHIYFHFNKNLKKRLYEIKPDILIASGSYISPSVLKAIRLKSKLNYQLFFWSESHLDELRNYSSLKLKTREAIRNSMYKKFDGFWYAGLKSLEFIMKYTDSSCTEIKYYFIPNLVDHDFFKKATELDPEIKIQLLQYMEIPSDHFVFVLPARLTEVKGILPFLWLFQSCSNKDRTTILILGEGELKQEIKQWSNENQLDVRLLGYMKQEDILCYYSIADCFLLPSLSDPNPLSCIEALWAGLPILVSEYVGNYPEVVKTGFNGYVFSYSEPTQAIHLIDTVIDSSEEWKQKAKLISREIAEESYEPYKAVKHLVDSMMNDINSDK